MALLPDLVAPLAIYTDAGIIRNASLVKGPPEGITWIPDLKTCPVATNKPIKTAEIIVE